MQETGYVVQALGGNRPEDHTAHFDTLSEARSYALELWAAGVGARISWWEIKPIQEYDADAQR